MAEARSCDAWNRATPLIVEMHNAWFEGKWSHEDVHPFMPPATESPQKASDAICDWFGITPPSGKGEPE